ncbi:MAG: PepSY-like domain-containing protein [Spirosomataceae bacterium]
MKNLIWIALFSLSIAFVSCNQDSVTPEDDSAVSEFLFMATTADSVTHKKKCNLTEIEVSALPAAVTAYISTTYVGSTINKAGKTDDGLFVVSVTKADGTKVGLVFNADGTFKAERTHKSHGTPVAVTALPKAITDYVTANYAGSTIEKAFQSTTDSSYKLVVKKSDGTFVGLGFDKDGKFVGEVSVKGKGKGKGRGNKPS